MPNNDLFRQILFNDGEGLTHDDLNDLAQLVLSKLLQEGQYGGAGIADSLSSLLSKDSDIGIDPFSAGFQSLNLSQNNLYTPYPMSGIIRPLDGGTGAPVINATLSNMVMENGILAQRVNGSTPGTAFAESPSVLTFNIEDEERLMGDDVVANPAPGAGNPRWDTWGVRIGYGADADPESRDFKDAITGALSSQSLNKRRRLTFESEFVTGPQSATFDMATLSAGFVPLMTLRRPVGEVTTAIDPDDVYYHVYPMRLGFEDVPGHELGWIGDDTQWDRDIFGDMSLAKQGAGTGTVYAMPRQMNEFTRLLGVGVMAQNAGNDFRVEVGRFDYNQATSAPSFTSLFDLGASEGIGAINGSNDGFQGEGEAAWSPTTAKRLPVWGNGTHRGPLYNVTRRGGVGAANTAGFSKLMVRLVNEGGGGGTNWAAGARIMMVRFFYLY